jgi:hypothetical protein
MVPIDVFFYVYALFSFRWHYLFQESGIIVVRGGNLDCNVLVITPLVTLVISIATVLVTTPMVTLVISIAIVLVTTPMVTFLISIAMSL